ncbi:MAG: TetR/AcrR family transcriptional regulator [Bacillota bacterium]
MEKHETKIDGRKKRSACTRKAILESAKSVFLEKGYTGTTFKDISSRAGIGYGTVYIHFKDKEELLQNLVDDVMTKIGKVVYINYSPSRYADVREIVYNQIYSVLKLARENRHVFQIIWDALGHSKVTRSYWDDIFNRFIERTIEDLHYSQEHHLARPLQTKIIAKGIVYMIREFLWDIVWERENDIEQISENLFELYTGGVYQTTE